MKSSFIYKVKEYSGKAIISIFGLLIDKISGKIIYGDPYNIKGIKELEKEYKSILEELNELIIKREIPGIEEYFKEQNKLTDNKKWKSFPLFLYGYEFIDNSSVCPNTTMLLRNVEGMCLGMFSILTAGNQIPPHKGPYKGVLRCHLGLVIPPDKENCYIEVDGIKKNWDAGKCICFDDTHLHMARNFSDRDRVVLFIDIIRPLPFPLNLINEILFNSLAKSEFIQEALENYKTFGNEHFKKMLIKF